MYVNHPTVSDLERRGHSVAIARYSGKIGLPKLKSKTGDGYRVEERVIDVVLAKGR